MARRIIIGEILNLIKGLGGNPKNYMGTKTNINFLGKGPKEALFQGQIDIDGLMRSGFPLERVIGEAERAGGYASANKLNDLQLQRLKDNLITLKKAYYPEQIPNITDLGTGTGDLTQQGLASLRRPGLDELGFGAKRSKDIRRTLSDELAGAEGVETAETILPTSTVMTRIADRMKNIQKMSDDLGAIGKGDVDKAGTYQFIDPAAEKASYASRFNPKNEVHVKKAEALLKDPQIKGVYTEAEVKNAYDFDGLYQSHFDKGHVDIARLFEMEGHNIPQMRASARDALLQLMKKERGLPGAESGLRDFVSAEDFKYISEGGGGRAGDPINLMVKYFGKNATENLPTSATKENINKFTDFIMAAKDRRGRGINDPFFDRETIDFSTFTRAGDDIPFKTGGRVGFKYGTRGLMKLVNKKFGKGTLKKASDLPKGTKYENLEAVKDFEKRESIGKGRDMLKEILAEDIESFRGKVDDNIIAELYAMEPGQQLRAIASVKEYLLNMKNLRQGQMLEGFDVTGRLPSASGGLAKILEV